MRRRRLTRRETKKRNRKIIVLCFSLFLMLSVGYAAFQTTISVNVKGNTKIMYASDTMKKLLRNNSLTMMTDPFGNIRYTGPNEDVHNYVCLVDENSCQDKNLFRIIGSFLNIDDGNGKLETRVKVIKATEYSNDYWDTSGSNNWARPATLNTTINTTYYDSLDSEVKNLIGNAVWNLGGHNTDRITSSQIYEYERGNATYCSDSSDITTCYPSVWTGKIALMYPSDYGFASKECYQSRQLWNNTNEDYRNIACTNSNWLFTGKYEWLLTRHKTAVRYVFVIDPCGIAGYNNTIAARTGVSRPTFFLKSNTILITKNHDGTFNNPYIVMLDEN